MEDLIKVRVSTKFKKRFHLALKANKETEEVVLHMMMADYVEKYEEDVAAKKLIDETNLINAKKATNSN